jgi:hypothetical protein
MDTAQSSTQRPARSSAFLVGQNSRGHWVAQDQHGLRGGLFVSCDDAVRYAVLANIHHPQDVIFVSETLELDMTARAGIDVAAAARAQGESSVVELKPHLSPSLQPAQSPGFAAPHTERPRKIANGR